MHSSVAYLFAILVAAQSSFASQYVEYTRYVPVVDTTCTGSPVEILRNVPGTCMPYLVSQSLMFACDSITLYNSTDCSGTEAATLTGTCSEFTGILPGSATVECKNSPGVVVTQEDECGGVLEAIRFVPTVCSNITGRLGSTTQATVGANPLVVREFSDQECENQVVSESGTNGFCAFGRTLSLPSSGSAPCFHSSTRIKYEGEEYTLEQLGANKLDKCTVPHVVQERGTIIEAKCAGGVGKTLRLTDGHLVYSGTGIKAASEVTTDDVLFEDIAETQECQVTSVKKETGVQRYFGLNCINSQVLASGLKTSTFEKLHSLPSFWMSMAGSTIGIKKASLIGETVADLVLSVLPKF